MVTCQLNRREFEGLARGLLESGHALRFRAHGISMRPFIRDGDLVEVAPVREHPLRPGDVVLCSCPPGRILVHRVIRVDPKDSGTQLLIQGDALRQPDGLVCADQVLGWVRAVQHGQKTYRLDSLPHRILSRLWALSSPGLKKTRLLEGLSTRRIFVRGR